MRGGAFNRISISSLALQAKITKSPKFSATSRKSGKPEGPIHSAVLRAKPAKSQSDAKSQRWTS